MHYNFDVSPDLRAVHALKWTMYPEDVLPMWVADMDFTSAQPIIDALTERVQYGTFGYTMDYPPLREVLVGRMQARYGWAIQPEWLVFIPGMVTTMNIITRALGRPGGGILMETPVYPPFLMMPATNHMFAQMVELRQKATGSSTFTYETDPDAFEAAITRQTTLFYLCNPHNPAGLVYSPELLARLAEICLRHNITIVSDEIHSDLILEGRHTPIAALSPEVQDKTLTLIAPSKTFNLAGLACSIAIIPNDATRKAVTETLWGTGLHVNLLGLVGAHAAYAYGDEWLTQALAYLRENRDTLVDFIAENLPQVRTTVPAATYMAWLDFSNLPTPDDVPIAKYLAEVGKVGLNAGSTFQSAIGSRGRDSFARLNFGTPRARLLEGLGRILKAANASANGV